VRLSFIALGSVMLVVVACSSSSSEGGGGSGAPVPLGQATTGIATFYTSADGTGSCSYDATSDVDIAAFDLTDFAGSAACGECIQLTGPKGTVTVKVVDSCPPCEDHHLDLSPGAFAKIADPAQGRVDITYQAIACDVTGNISYYFKDGSSKYWTAIQIRNHKIPVTKLEYMKDGAWTDMPRADYNFFIDANGVGDQPNGLQVRVTAEDGQVLTDMLPGTIPSSAGVDGSSQFN
jgi:expansin